MVTLSDDDRQSHNLGLYSLDPYGLLFTPFPPNIHKLLLTLNELDEKQRVARAELNQEAEHWIKENNLGYYYNLDTPTGPIAFFKRQKRAKGQTLVTHLRTRPGVLAQIKKIKYANNKKEA